MAFISTFFAFKSCYVPVNWVLLYSISAWFYILLPDWAFVGARCYNNQDRRGSILLCSRLLHLLSCSRRNKSGSDWAWGCLHYVVRLTDVHCFVHLRRSVCKWTANVVAIRVLLQIQSIQWHESRRQQVRWLLSLQLMGSKSRWGFRDKVLMLRSMHT